MLSLQLRAIKSLLLICASISALSQTVAQKLTLAYDKMMRDTQFKHSIVALTVIDQQTGKLLFERNGNVGLAAASTQKLFTAVAAYDLLGQQFRYKTRFNVRSVDNTTIRIIISGSGDPTLGSWRWPETRPEELIKRLDAVLQSPAYASKSISLAYNPDSLYDPVPVPGTWIVDDIGNYYGAGSWEINWRENQYDLHLSSGNKTGSGVTVRMDSNLPRFSNHLTVGKPGSGDNAYIYLPIDDSLFVLKGTIPPNERDFVISGAVTDGRHYLLKDLARHWEGVGRRTRIEGRSSQTAISGSNLLLLHESPVLDSVIFYFLRKSVNLYGEALLKAIGYRMAQSAGTEVGAREIKNHFISKKIPAGAMRFYDGSGLSPQNRITANGLATVLLYATKRDWFQSFYAALPLYNGMKMKSGSIGGVRSFAGYHTAANGKKYCFSIIVNNYDGGSGTAIQKMYKVLDELK